jgi:MerR family redox-sensitive transcriptional activator SoxR
MGEPQHHRRGIDPNDRGTESGCVAGGGTWPASDVGHSVTSGEVAEVPGQAGVTPSACHHAGRGEESDRPGETRVVGVVIGDGALRGCHVQTLTVEPGFKSSGCMPDLMTIGEVAHRAHVATSTIRYYERRGLLSADARQSGQRRYRIETLRRLVFIGMMQDIGLTLDEVHGVLNAATAADWKSIAGQRLAALDEQIAQLQHARGLLAGALWCRFDHPATDCTVMGAEIDRRLDRSGTP